MRALGYYPSERQIDELQHEERVLYLGGGRDLEGGDRNLELSLEALAHEVNHTLG